jgi:two-component system chemotaxis sensor kinase CheA
MSDDTSFSIRLLEVFRTEAREHRLAIMSALKELEQGADAERAAVTVHAAFRAAHTLKGAARAVNNSEVAELCQMLESIFSLLKNGRRRLAQEMFGVLREALDRIEKMEAGGDDNDSAMISRLNEIRGSLDG